MFFLPKCPQASSFIGYRHHHPEEKEANLLNRWGKRGKRLQSHSASLCRLNQKTLVPHPSPSAGSLHGATVREEGGVGGDKESSQPPEALLSVS